MRLKKLLVFCVSLVLISSCGSDFKQLASGFELRKIESKGGDAPKDAEAISVHMNIAIDDSLVIDSRELYPIGRRLAMNNMWPDFKDVLRRVGKGDSIQVRMSLAQYAKLEGRSTALRDSSAVVLMSIRVLDVDDEAKLIEKMVNDQLNYEIEQIERYLINNNLEAERTEEGVYYIISRQGDGDFVSEKDNVSSYFTLRLLDGRVLASTDEEINRSNGLHTEGREYGPYEFTLTRDRSLEGWRIGVPKLREGGSGTLFIPSRYAFGVNGISGSIAPNTTVVYDIEILDLNK